MLFDSHTHLESPRFDKDREDVIARALKAGVTRMVTCGSDLATSQACVDLAQAHEGVYAAVGIHPHEARSALADGDTSGSEAIDERAFQRLETLADSEHVVAIGELGLDYHYDFSPRP